MDGRSLITGAAGALGRSVVRRFLAAGDRVLAVDQSDERLGELAEDAASWDTPAGDGALATVAADLTDSAAVSNVFDRAGDDGPVRAVAHLVGGFRYAPLHETDDDAFSFLVAVNLETTFRVAREASRRFRASGGGALVAVSAPAGLDADPGVGVYAATKAGVLRLVEALGRELVDHGGRANAVLPGTMDTPGNREAMPDADPSDWVSTDAVASVIHLLTTSETAAVNGAAVRVPGPTA